jgi:hypothetical protein
MIIRRTVGLGQTGQQIAGTAYSAGTSIATVPVAGVLAGAVPAISSLAIPIVGAAFAGIWLGIEALINSGCGQSCVITSDWANQAEAWLKKNLDAYLSLPTPRAQSAQAAYLANFDKILNYLVQECSNPQLGGAGQRCISDRQSGACHFHDANGACWNWVVGYRDPIANDSNVVPDSAATQVSGAVTGAFTGAAGSLGISPWLLGGVALLVIGLGVASS